MSEAISVQCCVVGGGPAGMMLGLLLARAGVEVLVLEKHKDFLRDFRGDTIHPSTLELIYELGMLDAFLKLPHQQVRELRGRIGAAVIPIADFGLLPTHCRFLAMMPQWDFLNFLAQQAARYPTFRLRMEAEVTSLIEEAGRVVGVEVGTAAPPLQVRAGLVVGADGRSSSVRERAGLLVEDIGAPMDVLWFRLSRRPDDTSETMGRFDRGRVSIMINRGEHWQCAYVIAKGSVEKIHERGIEQFRTEVARLMPFAADRVGEIAGWHDVKLLTVRVDRLTQWSRPGLLCIGDAAHAMSPVGGVGINLAIQDAVAAANILSVPLREKRVTRADLLLVQARREFPTRMTQRVQVLVQNRIITRVLGDDRPLTVPLAVQLLGRWRWLRGLTARFIGIGVRPEHIRSPLAAEGGSF
jgi:2-polyprenyl-6-methoxyphenol hydroxylase-like FAD-dependent oxidoreductase